MHWFLSQQKYIKIYTSAFSIFLLPLKSSKNKSSFYQSLINSTGFDQAG